MENSVGLPVTTVSRGQIYFRDAFGVKYYTIVEFHRG